MQSYAGPEFLKGHGTENDFVVLPDPRGELELTTARVRALCDRRSGLGADGVLRVVPGGLLGEELPADVPADAWFMDYRNADGSVAEMCGNGVRVFARYLLQSGLVSTGTVPVGTRAGLRSVVAGEDGRVTVDMGAATVLGHSSLGIAGYAMSALAVDLGNPHLVCVTTGVAELDLSVRPGYDPELFPAGVNIELVEPLDERQVRMRVYERGIGETRSCGTGTVAATVAALRAAGAENGVRLVHVPGGTVEVEVTPETTTLTGPAELVARGRLDAGWWGNVEEPALVTSGAIQ
ncbi:diaminopimelate epimerase [Actinopolyspora xinjiangensis]|uniref:Diaminopimelate epimerase n=1 Tax=Actinopolyspora xinjiangensis TaxID=405564 RepID=A0A1H0TJB7_9ACTN|nr:diaminopimelate epimerase [Actinopolyspora xinjiangensis]SDP53678.1 diaminopimelate epimerase [Actinopolyspora xinjiangensis]